MKALIFWSYAGKEAILAQDEATFLNSVSLLCEVFEHLRLADGTVINVLAVGGTNILECHKQRQVFLTSPGAHVIRLQLDSQLSYDGT